MGSWTRNQWGNVSFDIESLIALQQNKQVLEIRLGINSSLSKTSPFAVCIIGIKYSSDFCNLSLQKNMSSGK